MVNCCRAMKLTLVAPLEVVLSNTETALSSATTRSVLPSPLTSAATTNAGPDPASKLGAAAKVALVAPVAVWLNSTETAASLRTINSALPSPLRSAATRSRGRVPTSNACCVGKIALVVPGVVALSAT